MNSFFVSGGLFSKKQWGITDQGVVDYDGTVIPFAQLTDICVFTMTLTKRVNGQVKVSTPSSPLKMLDFKYEDNNALFEALKFAVTSFDDAHDASKGYRYRFIGSAGTIAKIYDDPLTIKPVFYNTVSATGFSKARSFESAEKSINYTDITAIKYQPGNPGEGTITIEYPGALKDENIIRIPPQMDADAKEALAYIEQYRSEHKQGGGQTTIINQVSGADELKKYKELLDIGAITQEEFDEKKRQILAG